jgi:hypothetical protein
VKKADWCVSGGLKPGDLVKLIGYPSKYETVGDVALVLKDTTAPLGRHQVVEIRYTGGGTARKPHFTLEVINGKG